MIESLYIERIQRVFDLLENSCYQALIITASDPHGSEYPAKQYALCEELVGFSGSFGSLLFWKEENHFSVGLWTDSRYHLEAAQKYDGTIVEFFPLGKKGVLDPIAFLATKSAQVKKAYVEGSTLSEATFAIWQRQLMNQGIDLVVGEGFLAPLKKGKSFDLFYPPVVLPLAMRNLYCFSSDFPSAVEERFASLRSRMAEEAIDCLWFSKLDQIAWLLDLRGKDVAYNAFFYSYFLLCPKGGILYLRNRKIDEKTFSFLQDHQIYLVNYPEDLNSFELFPIPLQQEVLGLGRSSFSLAYQKGDCCKALQLRFEVLKIQRRAVPSLFSFVEEYKALRTPQQLDYLEQCMIVDGLALARLHRWMKDRLEQRGWVREMEVVEANETFRAEASEQVLGREHYLGASFSTIAAAAANGALVHYHSSLGNAKLEWEQSFLLDTGGLFLGATTDMTRVFYFSQKSNCATKELPSESSRYANLKRYYTLVLKGNLALSRQRFPSGASGSTLDSFARQFLWQEELDYGHSTGHGVGSGLNVHEGPHGISKNSSIPLKSSMIVTNEPGFYLKGEFGIRIENMMKVLPPSDSDFLGFETLTLFPYEKELIDLSLLTSQEIAQINRYHQKVRNKLFPYLSEEERRCFEGRCVIY